MDLCVGFLEFDKTLSWRSSDLVSSAHPWETKMISFVTRGFILFYGMVMKTSENIILPILPLRDILGFCAFCFSPLEGILETSNRHGLQWSQGCAVFEAPGIVFLDTWQQILTATIVCCFFKRRFVFEELATSLGLYNSIYIIYIIHMIIMLIFNYLLVKINEARISVESLASDRKPHIVWSLA